MDLSFPQTAGGGASGILLKAMKDSGQDGMTLRHIGAALSGSFESGQINYFLSADARQ
jgi:hypothetical protein